MPTAPLVLIMVTGRVAKVAEVVAKGKAVIHDVILHPKDQALVLKQGMSKDT